MVHSKSSKWIKMAGAPSAGGIGMREGDDVLERNRS